MGARTRMSLMTMIVTLVLIWVSSMMLPYSKASALHVVERSQFHDGRDFFLCDDLNGRAFLVCHKECHTCQLFTVLDNMPISSLEKCKKLSLAKKKKMVEKKKKKKKKKK